jgi:hypothetical protein
MSGTMKPIKLVLPCQMTDEEYASKSKEFMDWANDQARREAAIKALKDMHKLPIKHAKDKQLEIRETLNTQTVAREVDCFQVYNWETMNTHQRRGDTGEMVPGSVRKMTKDEMQMDHTQAAAPTSYLMIENCPEAEEVETAPSTLALPAPAVSSELQTEAVDAEIDSIEKEDDGFEIVEDSIDSPETEMEADDIEDRTEESIEEEELF